MEKKKKVIVIGGGFSGLATASLLAKEGYAVDVYEKNSDVGGRARVLRDQGFTFDMGPSWYLMPEVFEKFFSYFGKSSKDFYSLHRLDPHYRIYFEGNNNLEITDNFEATKNTFEKLEASGGQKLEGYIHTMKQAYALSQELMYMDIFKKRNWVALSHLRQLTSLGTLFNPVQSWHSLVRKYFKDNRLQKVLEFPAMFLGSSPYDTPALYSLLSYADLVGGVWYPMGGMGKVVDGMVRIAEDSGVGIHCGVTVDSIRVENGVTKGVVIAGELVPADAVVGSMDTGHLEMKMLEEKYRSFPETYWKSRQLGFSALLLYIGVGKRLKNISHHMLYFTDDWKKNFDALFGKAALPEKVSFYVSARSVTDRSIVPEDCEELFVLVPVASESYSPERLYELREQVLTILEGCIGETFRESIVYQKMYGPDDFARDYFATSGTALGLGHTLRQSLFGRPGSVSRKVKGLFYAGQYTNPGVGVPMALISGELAARRVYEYLR